MLNKVKISESRLAIVLGLGLFVSVSMFANGPDTLWTLTLGESSEDRGRSVQQTTDGGYIITGYTCSYGAGSYDVYLIKTDSLGDTLWTRTFGGSASDVGYSVQQTTDGGYIIAGITYSYGAGYADVWLIKTDLLGNTLWTRTYGGSDWDEAYSVQQTTDGGYIIAGYTKSYGAGDRDVYLIKTDSLGDTLWTRTYGGSDWDEAYSVQQTTDGGYIIAGITYSYGAGYADVWLIKTDLLGNTLWTRTFGGSSSSDGAYSVQQTTDGGYIIAGFIWKTGDNLRDVYLIKTDAKGNVQWVKTFGGRKDDVGNSVQQTKDGGYLIAGKTNSYGAGYADVWLIKTDLLGNTLWTRTYGGSDWDEAYSVQQTTDGGYIIAGYTKSYGAGDRDVYLVRTSAK